MKVGIIGLGLMGGSFSMDIKNIYKKSKTFGFDSSESNYQMSMKLKLIDGKLDDNNISDMDVVLISVPVDETVKILPDVLNKIGNNTLVIDVGSTKNQICKSVSDHKNRKQFLATHPIAGTENSGPNASVSGLYFGVTNILCEIEKTEKYFLEKAMKIFSDFRMKIIYRDSKSHDEHISYVSHLSHVTSFMLAKTVIEKEKNEKNIFDMAGSGFESTVRLAKSSPEMWTDIFEDNKKNIIKSLDDYIENLVHINSLIKKDRFNEVESQLKSTNYIKTILKGIN